jgi:FkbM family methyltransferase
MRTKNAAIPTDPGIDRFLSDVAPDVLAVTPLIEPGSPQAEYLRSARALGIRTAYCVASWDNLTNKGLIHGPVDLVTVWNEMMKSEAVTMHGVPPADVTVTGAPAFDHWFEWQPGRSREEFCARVHLPADRPYVLYLCSSRFVAPDEVPFVRRWLEQIRASDGPLRGAGVLVRPHPQNAEQWQGVDLGGFGPAAVWPRGGAAPVDDASRADYFESMYYSAAVVGMNTTAEIESAILGKPVHALLAPEFQDTQDGTLHFRHLRQVNGGLLHVATTMGEHVQQLSAAVATPGNRDEQSRRFVEAFVRPHGMGVPATPLMVRALEQLASRPRRVQQPSVWSRVVRTRLAPAVAELERQARVAATPAGAAEADAAKEAKRLAREMERRERLEERAREEEARRAARAEEGKRAREGAIDGAVQVFEAMGEVDRRAYLRAIVSGFPADMFIELQAANKPRRLDYDRADIYLRVTSKAETFRVKACAKEPFTIDWIHGHLAAGDVLYDIGANVGAYSLVAARQPGGGARVFAFEPSYANLAALYANIALNDAARQITPMPMALSGRTAMSVFHLRDPQPGGARHVLDLGAAGTPHAAAGCPQPVLMFRLDDVVETFALPLPNHIKLDVDGGELDVIAGAARTLASPSLRSLLIEVSSELSTAVIDALAPSGLRLESKIERQNEAGEFAVWYGLFGRER